MAQLNFNASEVAPDTGSGDPLPEGWYNVMIDESDIKPTKDAAVTGGAFLAIRFNVIDGQFQGRKLFSRFNIRNQNPTAQEIGYKQLSAVAHAVGVLMVQDSQQLHGIPLKVRVKVRAGNPKDANNPNGEKYDPSNDITAYKNINEVVAQVAAPAPQGFAAPEFTRPAAAPGGFAGFGAPPPQAPAPAAPNPMQWAQPQQPAQPQFAPAAQQQFAPAPAAQPAPAPAAAPQQFAAPQQPWAQPVAPQQFAQPPAQPGPAFVPPQAPQQQFAAPQAPQFAAPAAPQQQFAQPATMQAPAAPQAPAVAAAQSSAPPWARPAA